MERVWRRRTPAFVRSLLMDVSLKEDELSGGTEPEQMSKDGISLPVTAACGADLTPAAEEEDTSSSSSSSSLRPCGLCLSNPARYTCPRCNVSYCALSCYRGSAHTACSEQFYKDCVSQELRQRGRAAHEDRIHMRDILLRMRRAEGGLGGVMRELMENSGGQVTERDTETLTLLSRLAEIQTDREEGHEDEVQDILQRLAQTDAEEEEGEEEEDVVTKLSGLNIESLTEDELWTLLPEKDKQKFERLLKDGGISALVPIWRPWWEEHERDRVVLIEELQREGREETSSVEEEESRDVQDLDTASEHPSPLKQEVKKQKVKMEGSRDAPPPISCEIPPLSSLCSASPSPLVKFSLVNVLCGYAFTLRLFNGDVWETQQLLEFTRLLLSVSECLGRSRTFGSFSEALSAAMASISAELYDSDSALSAVEDVAHILSGASKDDRAGYTLSALAQLRSAFGKARTAAPRDHAHFRRMCFLAGKKCEFLQAWANENTHTLRGLARRAWSECQRQTGERQEMERDRKQMEEGWKKGRARGKVMIEEI
ncbi:zinc finger HIT domain-containing protein 2 [Pangasianodon hypophthalmus]|uniref:zinc finger HIT domain-containing protein 2 n=1 Tax=Pangasianodon hypophthalmus TaxID=310915 RepID=UPI002307C54A|nr:zinc finger HIT domain-containing protein 2 [Pangasianodon hypophthalmus]